MLKGIKRLATNKGVRFICYENSYRPQVEALKMNDSWRHNIHTRRPQLGSRSATYIHSDSEEIDVFDLDFVIAVPNDNKCRVISLFRLTRTAENLEDMDG